MAQDVAGHYAIELKVESATNTGAALLASAQQDMVKIQNYSAPVPGAPSGVRGYGRIAAGF